MKANLINFFAFVGALDTLLVPIVFSRGQEPFFPLPGLYLIEIGVIGLAAMASIFSRQRPLVAWSSAGVLLAFVILGALSIGFFLVPGFLAFSAAALLWHGSVDRGLLRPLGIFTLAAIIQAALMLILFQLI